MGRVGGRLCALVGGALLALALPQFAEGQETVTIRFLGETRPQWEVIPQSEVLRTSRGEVFDRDLRVRNKSDREVLAMILTEILPPAAASALIHLGCGPAFTLILGPGEAATVPASYVVAEGARADAGAIEVVYTVHSFEPLASVRLRAGGEIYAARCATCHGPRGRGDGPIARLLGSSATDLAPALRWKSDRELLDAVRSGIGVMPAFAHALDESEHQALLLYLRSLGPSGDAGAAR